MTPAIESPLPGAAELASARSTLGAWAVRGLDDGEREPHIPVLRFPSGSATPLQLLQEATGTASRGNDDQQHRDLASALEAWTTVAVVLPPEAHTPGLRPVVIETHLRLAEKQIATARESLERARKALEEIEKKSLVVKPAIPAASKPLVSRVRSTG